MIHHRPKSFIQNRLGIPLQPKAQKQEKKPVLVPPPSECVSEMNPLQDVSEFIQPVAIVEEPVREQQ